MRMMGRLLVCPSIMVLRGFLVMAGGVLQVFCGLLVMFSSLLRHVVLLMIQIATIPRPHIRPWCYLLPSRTWVLVSPEYRPGTQVASLPTIAAAQPSHGSSSRRSVMSSSRQLVRRGIHAA